MIKEIKGYIKKELTIVFYSCRIQLTSTDVENKILGESTMKTKFMTLMTVATLGIFSAATVMAAGNNDFYTQPPAGSEWEKADTEGTYASYTNGNDYVNIYKYSLEDVKTGIAKCNDTYDACRFKHLDDTVFKSNTFLVISNFALKEIEYFHDLSNNQSNFS